MTPPPDPAPDLDALLDQLRRLEARLSRERRARGEAERLLETKSFALYEANVALSALAADLERRVEQRTRELSLARQRALQLAEIDMLTGIANRASFARQLGEALADPQATVDGVATLLIDLDDFKSVNDTQGHAAGDALLVEFARRLVDAVRPGDVVARLGGDEFAVIAKAVNRHEGAPRMAIRLHRLLCRPAVIEGRHLPCSCSIGLAVAQPGGGDADALLRDADLALYASKRGGRGRVTPFEAGLRAAVERRATLDAQVRKAVTEDRIEPWYQPIHRYASGRYIAAEMMVRWHKNDGTVVPANAFLESVEALSLLDTMMENVLRRALWEARPAVRDGLLEYLSINVSSSQFNQGWVLHRLPALLAESGFPSHAVVIEIKEAALLQDVDGTHSMLAALADIGMRIAIDDFGVAQTHFSMLRKLPLAILKLDRSLIADIALDDRALALTDCILQLAKRLRIKVVAEGVETQRQAELLAAAGCDAMQGFLFAGPRRHLDKWFAPLTPKKNRWQETMT